MDKPEKIKIGCCPFCGGNIKRANMKAFSGKARFTASTLRWMAWTPHGAH